MRDAECVALLQWMLPQLRLRWPGFRKVRRQVCKRIERRLRELQLPDAAAYRAYLETHEEERRVFDGFCRISISRFYRDRWVFDRLRDSVLPELAALARSRGDDAFCCWSAGCASGEEVYTLKMIHRLCVAPRFVDLSFRLIATDCDETMLQRARQGCYSFSSLKDLPRDWLVECFDRRDDLFCVRDEFRDGIDFRLQDIRQEMPDGPFHLILCRHLVFTYFDEPLQRTILTSLLERLVPSGILVTGKQEPLPPGASGIEELQPKSGIYRQIPQHDVD